MRLNDEERKVRETEHLLAPREPSEIKGARLRVLWRTAGALSGVAMDTGALKFLRRGGGCRQCNHQQAHRWMGQHIGGMCRQAADVHDEAPALRQQSIRNHGDCRFALMQCRERRYLLGLDERLERK